MKKIKKLTGDISKQLRTSAPILEDLNTQLAKATLAIVMTVTSMITVTLITYDGGFVTWAARLLVRTSALTGTTAWEPLYSGFASALIILIFLTIYLVSWAFDGLAGVDDDDIPAQVMDMQRRLGELRQEQETILQRLTYLYERESCREYGGDNAQA